MNRIIPHIEYLLSRHDCVIIPGFGGFVSNYEPSYIDKASGTLYPPSRKILFNRDLNHNDGLLVTSVARKMKISYNSALSVVNEAVEDIIFHIGADFEVPFGSVGTFSSGKEHTIIFSDFTATPFTDFFSVLSPIRLLPINAVTPVGNDESGRAVITQVAKPVSIVRRFVRAVASIAMLIAIGLTVLTTNDIDTCSLQKASLIPSEDKAFVLNTPPDIELLIAKHSPCGEIAEQNRSIVTQSDRITGQSSTSANLRNEEPCYVENPSADKHYLIVASMPSLRRAKMFISQKNDSRLGIVKMGKRYRVFAAVAYSEDEVIKLKSDPEFDKKYPKAWPTHAD